MGLEGVLGGLLVVAVLINVEPVELKGLFDIVDHNGWAVVITTAKLITTLGGGIGALQLCMDQSVSQSGAACRSGARGGQDAPKSTFFLGYFLQSTSYSMPSQTSTSL